jgi:hypothetical protein
MRTLLVATTLDGRTRVAEQGELLVTPVRHGALALAGGFGARHEYGGTWWPQRASSVPAPRSGRPWPRAFSWSTPMPPASHALTSTLWLGVEAVGSDLEGFWDSGEAEGGATLFVGPTLAFSPAGSWRLVVGGGAVLRTTSSTAAPSAQQRSGYVLRTSVRLGW